MLIAQVTASQTKVCGAPTFEEWRLAVEADYRLVNRHERTKAEVIDGRHTGHVVADEFDPFQVIGEASDVIRPLGSFEHLFWLNGLHRPPNLR